MKKLFSTLIILCIGHFINAQQVHVNRVFNSPTGNPVFNPILNPFGLEWTKSIVTATNDIITVAHTSVSSQGENVLVTRTTEDGGLIWQVNYNTSGSKNDYGIDVVEEPSSGDIYVVGTTDNNGTTDYDIIILRYSSGGSLLSSTSFNGPDGINDIGTAIIIDSNGNVSIAGSSESLSTSYDYIYLCYDTSLSFLYSGTYDYASLIDVPVGIEDIGGKITIAGASANSLTDWDYAVAEFDVTSGAYVSDNRDNIPGVGYDQPLAFCKDASNNTYVTGRASTDGINYDVRTMMIDNLNNIVWIQSFDANGLEDCGNTIAVDGSGNVIIGGFITNSNNIKELVCLKYNSSGTLLWSHNQPSKDMTADAFIKKIVLNTNNDIYFMAGEKGYTGNKEVIIGKIKPNGKKSWERNIKGNYDYLPSDIQYGGFGAPGLYTIVIKDSTTNVYQTAMYTEHERDTARVFKGNGKPWYKKNEMIVRFQASAMDTAAINNHVATALREYGDLSDFLTASAYTTVVNALSPYCGGFCDVKAVKIFDDPTTFTSITSNLGETIPIPDFWTALLLEFPTSIPIQTASSVFKTMPNVVAYAHPNYFIKFHTALPNDTMYKSQHSIKTSTLYPNGSINAEEAWDIVPSGGDTKVKIGLFDTGCDWKNKDFNYDGSIPGSTKITGWNVALNSQITSVAQGDSAGHGTACMGILGAQRNNTVGIAGIAGGDWSNNSNQGAQLYSYNIVDDINISPTIANTIKALTGAVKQGDQMVNYSQSIIKVMNNSWGIDSVAPYFSDTNITILSETVHLINRAKTTFVASRGNDGYDKMQWPAIYDDDWVMNVGGLNVHGNYKRVDAFDSFAASYGHNVDIAAPASLGNVISTGKNDIYYSFNGTSASAPHVTGVVGLLMSYMNKPGGLADPQNLAPEDCEFIIQQSASPVTNGASLPNDSVGYGKLNAGKALRMVEKPFRTLYHFATNTATPYTISKSVYSNSDIVKLTEWYQNLSSTWFKPGKYLVKTFEISASLNHSFTYPTDSLMYYWPRHSSSEVLELFDGNNKIRPHEKIIINSLSSSNATMKGYVYRVSDTLGNFKGWWPCDTSFSAIGTRPLFSYSILTKNKAVGINEKDKDDLGINIYPNPASNQQTIKIEANKISDISILLYDLMGRLLKTVYIGKTGVGENIYHNDVNNLPNSMYIYVIKMDGKPVTKRFIKQ